MTNTAAAQIGLRPRFEGANIRTWIGFKHLMYLVEEAVIQWLRDRDCGPHALYHQHGLGLEIVDSSVQLPALVEIDDELICDVSPTGGGRFSVTLRLRRPTGTVLALRGKVAVALVPETGAARDGGLPAELTGLLSTGVAGPGVPAHRPAVEAEPETEAGEAPAPGAAAVPFEWTWTARYFHCHFSDRVQHSAYVRALEEVVDRFLAACGLSIRTLLEQRGWIPVVSRARVQLLGAAHMEEDIRTTFLVHEVLKDAAFDATMNCYAVRGEELVPVATAQILHGYAASRGPNAGRLVTLDAPIQATLMGTEQG